MTGLRQVMLASMKASSSAPSVRMSALRGGVFGSAVTGGESCQRRRAMTGATLQTAS